jgi:hypothetical protein
MRPPVVRITIRSVDELDVFSRRTTVTACAEFVFDLLAFSQTVDACPFQSGDVNEHILALVFWLDETKALCRVDLTLPIAILYFLRINSTFV